MTIRTGSVLRNGPRTRFASKAVVEDIFDFDRLLEQGKADLLSAVRLEPRLERISLLDELLFALGLFFLKRRDVQDGGDRLVALVIVDVDGVTLRLPRLQLVAFCHGHDLL